ncbi:putative fatty acyl-CoA reductase 7 [Morus notabilis]|uniref:putative fatty acyl-CoA reductase 7 n=1 Tax=Morus notabilis TaxID=981085 RepID=UPI000CED3FB3|nr:putative fatty acyl-CoA reductase 7 [Morus notabilis]
MESENMVQFFEKKTILVTGATGFLAKILVEKLLRVEPEVKKLYLLLRAPDSNSARKRIHDEVIGKELFSVLRRNFGKDFESFIWEKVVAVPGDVANDEDLGIKDLKLSQEMFESIDVIVNSAATTNFDERYDVSLGINTTGVLHILNFAKKCKKLKIFLHLSTAYVCGEREGLIQEKAFHFGETLKKTNYKLDYKVEEKLVAKELQELRGREASEETITATLKDFGMKRAKLFGWPNTYVFTKAMGEMCLQQSDQDNLSIVIIRPTMITSTYKDPFPGWIEGVRTVDSVIVGYGKGKVTSFLGSPSLILDLIPADMVVNAIVVAIVAHAQSNQTSAGTNTIYHVGSSLRNPMHLDQLHKMSTRHFIENPLMNKNGKPIRVAKIRFLKNMARFRMHMGIRAILPLKILQLVNLASCHYFLQDAYTRNKRKIHTVMRLVMLYKPYLLFKGVFDDKNSERLRTKAKDIYNMEIMEAFNFDPACIDWEEYMITHISGLKKYCIK